MLETGVFAIVFSNAFIFRKNPKSEESTKKEKKVVKSNSAQIVKKKKKIES